MTAVIPLTKGLSTVVDKEMFYFLNQWKWNTLQNKFGKPYAHRSYKHNGKTIHVMMHRVILGTSDGMVTDHINGDTLLNTLSNLREVTHSQNMWNRSPNKDKVSPHKGVYWHKQHSKWCASIQSNKKRIHLGLFHDDEEAAEAYRQAALLYHGKYKRIT